MLALAADFRLVAEAAKFSFLFTRVGLAGADMGVAYLLPRLVGLGRATELLILGGEVDADHAAEIGLGTRVDDLAAATQELARRLADGPSLAYATTKVLLTRELDLDLGGAIEMEALAQALLMKGEDFREFYASWSEGRSDRQPSGPPGAVGYAHAVVAGGVIYLGGQIGEGATVVEQFDLGRRQDRRRVACSRAGEPSTSSRSWSTRPKWRSTGHRRRAGAVWRRHFGRRYPAMALVGVDAFLDPDAKVELMGVAVLER